MLTQEQINERLKYITGSDAAVICGLSPFKTKLQLWMEKTGRIVQEDIGHLNHIKFGNFFEQGVADWFAQDANKVITKEPNLLVHKSLHWMAGNIDFKVEGENAILECKTAFNDEGWGSGENIIPIYYLMQVAHYCAVGDFDKAYIAVVFAAKREMRWYRYDRNLELEAKLIAREQEFWINNVLSDIAPEPQNEKDILLLYKETKADPIIANNDILLKLQDINQIKNQIALLEPVLKNYEEELRLFMKDHDTLIDESGQILATWKYTKPINRFNAKKLKEDNEKLWNKYLGKEDPQRRLVIRKDILT